jgi:archaellum biogenesis ATPase FlaH
MKALTPLNRILILEEQWIIGFDLGQQLKKRGYEVSFEKNYGDIQSSFSSGQSEIVISSLSCIQHSSGNGTNFLNSIDNATCDFRTDTIIMDSAMDRIKCFEKPYNIEDIVSFIHTLVKKEKKKVNSKSIN